MRRSLLIATLALLVLSHGQESLAKDMTDAEALALMEEARKAYLDGDFAEACPKYEEVVRARPGLGARMGLGDCYRASGRLASAWEVYSGIVADAPSIAEKATKAKDKATAQKREAEAKERMEDIKAKLSWLVLDVSSGVRALSNLRIQKDGETLDAERWTERIPLDGGDHVITAIASGKKLWQKRIHATTDSGDITVSIAKLEDDRAAGPGPSSLGKESDGSGSTGLFEPKSPGFGQRIGALAAGVVGLGAIGVGSYFGLRAIEKRDQSNEDGHCDDQSFCDSVGKGLREEGRALGDVSTALFIGGGVLVAGGVVLFVLAPKKQSPSSAKLMLGLGTIGVRGSF